MKTKTNLILIACLAISFCIASIEAEPYQKEKTLLNCKQLFGEPVDEKQKLFGINQFYVLHMKFDRHNNLEEFAVEPKYYYEESHPEWKEPDTFEYLSKNEYEKLLVQIDTIKPKGAIIKPAPTVSYVTNQTAWHTEIYKNATLTWGEVADLARGEKADYQVKWFRLNYGKRKAR